MLTKSSIQNFPCTMKSILFSIFSNSGSWLTQLEMQNVRIFSISNMEPRWNLRSSLKIWRCCPYSFTFKTAVVVWELSANKRKKTQKKLFCFEFGGKSFRSGLCLQGCRRMGLMEAANLWTKVSESIATNEACRVAVPILSPVPAQVAVQLPTTPGNCFFQHSLPRYWPEVLASHVAQQLVLPLHIQDFNPSNYVSISLSTLTLSIWTAIKGHKSTAVKYI